MESGNSDLRESVFFTARTATLPCDTEEWRNSASSSDPASSSSRYVYSRRILKNMMECVERVDMSKEDVAIEASKDHWTETESEYLTAAVDVHSSTSESKSVSGVEELGTMDPERRELDSKNDMVIYNLKYRSSDEMYKRFFMREGTWDLGRKIAEGGQAEIFEATTYYSYDYYPIYEYRKSGYSPIVLKVFKWGFSFSDLQKQWPLATLLKLRSEYHDDNRPSLRFCNTIHWGWMLYGGRFAFVMNKQWGDLRKFLDVLMEQNGNQRPPFMLSDGNYLECCMLKMMQQIATGMSDLHKEGTLHRDLKASNILIDSERRQKLIKKFFQYPPIDESDDFDPTDVDHVAKFDFVCMIADFECSVGVVGTGYWRAPEILEAVKDRTLHLKSNLFTSKSDVYSFGMICYEILTGFTPFEDVEDIGINDVLEGKRPTLPRHLKPWINELVSKCWHQDPSERPTFQEIVDILEAIDSNDLGCLCKSESRYQSSNQPMTHEEVDPHNGTFLVHLARPPERRPVELADLENYYPGSAN